MISALIGALGTAVAGTFVLIIRRLLYGKSEDEALATKAAHQAVEVVDDVLKTLREQRESDHEEILTLRTRVAELETMKEKHEREIAELRGEVRELKANGA